MPDQQDGVEEEEEVVVPVKKGKKKLPQKVNNLDEPDNTTTALTANEKRLQRKLDTVRRRSHSSNHAHCMPQITLALSEQATAFEQLKELRTTKAEESEKALTEVAAQRQVTATNTLAKYKSENSQLRQEILNLRSSFPNDSLLPTSVIPASPGSQPTLKEAITKIAKLEKATATFEEENVVLKGRADEAEGELKAAQEILEIVEKELESVKAAKEKIEAQAEATKKAAVAEADAAAKKANKDLLVEGTSHPHRLTSPLTLFRSHATPHRAHSRSSALQIPPTKAQILHPLHNLDIPIAHGNK